MVGIDQVVQDPDNDLQVTAGLKMGFLRFNLLLLKKVLNFPPAQDSPTVVRIYIKKDVLGHLIERIACYKQIFIGQDEIFWQVYTKNRKVQALGDHRIYDSQGNGIAFAGFQYLVDE
jgi:hypothetical protein